MSDATPATHPEFKPPTPKQPGAKERRNTLIQLGVALVIIIVIFGFVLPQVIDYEQVWETIKSLEPWQLVALLVAGLLLYVPEGRLYQLLMPGLTLWQGIKAWVASTAVGSTIPAADLVTRFGMYRSWGASTEGSMLGILLSGVFDNLVKFTLPILGIILLATVGVGDLEILLIFGVIAAVVLVVTIIVVVGVVRSEAFTIKVATWAENAVNWVLARFKREPIEVAERVVGFRDAAVDLVRAVWWRAVLAAAIGKLWAFVILVMAMRFAGIDEQALSTMDIFVVWTIVLLIQSIPITPGGIGIVGVAYIWAFTQILGDEWSNTIAAGVALFRLIQWALPIPIGWYFTLRWRRKVQRGDLPDPFAVGNGPAAESTPG